MERVSITQARAHLYQLVSDTAKTNNPVTIVGKTGNAVLISEADWESIRETMYLSSIPGLTESVRAAASAGDFEFVDADRAEW